VLKGHGVTADVIQAAARFGAVMTAAATVHATRI
jgi:alkyl hydroperoxide reductase subunit D